MAQTAQIERQVEPGDKINWLTAPPVPAKVMLLSKPDGEIIVGPGGQKTYRGPIRERSPIDQSWRDDLKYSRNG